MHPADSSPSLAFIQHLERHRLFLYSPAAFLLFFLKKESFSSFIYFFIFLSSVPLTLAQTFKFHHINFFEKWRMLLGFYESMKKTPSGRSFSIPSSNASLVITEKWWAKTGEPELNNSLKSHQFPFFLNFRPTCWLQKNKGEKSSHPFIF